MAQVIVRNLDEQVVSSLKLKAELHGHSLEQELREILKRAAELTVEEKLAALGAAGRWREVEITRLWHPLPNAPSEASLTARAYVYEVR